MSSEEPGKSPRRLWRGLMTGLGIVIILSVVALGLAVIFRVDVTHAVLQDQLKGLGVKDPRFQVDAITTKSISISNFSAGPALSFDRLTVAYAARELIRGRVSLISLAGLRVDTTHSGPWTGFEGKGAKSEGTDFDPAIIPEIDIRKASVRLASDNGPMIVSVAGSLLPKSDGAFAVQVNASTDDRSGKINLEYGGSVRLGESTGVAATGQLKLTAQDMAVGDTAVKSLKLEMPITVQAGSDGTLAVQVNGALVDADHLNLDRDVKTGSIKGSLTGRLTSANPSAGQFDATADILLDAESMRAGDLLVERFITSLTTHIKGAPGTLALTIAPRGRVSIDGARTAKNKQAVNFSTLLSGSIGLSRSIQSPDAGLTIEHELLVEPGPINLSGVPALHAVTGRIETRGTLAANGAYMGRVSMDTVRLTRGKQSLDLKDLSVRLATKAKLAKPQARIRIGAVQDRSTTTVAGAPIAGSYDLTATVEQKGKNLSYQATIGGLGIRKLAAIAGAHNLTTQVGRANIRIPLLRLGSGGVPLKSILPKLSAVRDTTGKIGAEARLNWNSDGLNGNAKIRLDGVGGRTDDANVEGISGTIIMDSLQPLSTAASQLLRIKKINAGAVLVDTSIRFTLQPTGNLRISRAETSIADGKLVVRAPTIDPFAGAAKATVTLEGVRLEQLLTHVDSGDIQASGRLYGSIPIRISDGKIAIDAGVLSSQGGGLLRFKSERANQILKSGGDQVALMLRALENFTYDRLGLDISKSMAGRARVKLRTLGHNPKVLKGRKFQINVNLDTNLDRLLEAALEWYRLSGNALHDIVRRRTRKGSQ